MLTSNKVNESTTFYDLPAAEWAVSQALYKKRMKILIYSKAKFLLMRPEYRFDIELDREVGWGITRQNPDDVMHLSKIRIVLKMTEYNHMPYFVLTAFPVYKVRPSTYGFLMGFMYDVGIAVGEFLEDEEKDSYVPLALPEIVAEYVDTHSALCVFFLKRNIKKYMNKNMTADGLEYVDPFDQELSFAEDYFEGDLHVFLTNVLSLLEAEKISRIRKYLFY
jgi:hypothetical protein